VSRSESEPESASLHKSQWPARQIGWSLKPAMKQWAKAVAGLTGVKGGSAQGKFGQGTWETRNRSLVSHTRQAEGGNQ